MSSKDDIGDTKKRLFSYRTNVKGEILNGSPSCGVTNPQDFLDTYHNKVYGIVNNTEQGLALFDSRYNTIYYPEYRDISPSIYDRTITSNNCRFSVTLSYSNVVTITQLDKITTSVISFPRITYEEDDVTYAQLGETSIPESATIVYELESTRGTWVKTSTTKGDLIIDNFFNDGTSGKVLTLSTIGNYPYNRFQ